MIASDPHRAVLALVIPVAAALICAGLIVVLRPLLQRYALARPNARSSHVTPTPQGGGIAVMAATAIAAALAGLLGAPHQGDAIPVVLAAAFCLAAVGMIDDLRPIPVVPRLALQLAAVTLLFATLPSQMRIFEAIPISLERMLLILGLLWFINLVNFMDGLDWMTVAEMLPMTVALAAFAFFGEAPAGHSADRAGSRRRIARLCTLQPAVSPIVPGRRRQPADRSPDRLVLARTGIAPTFCRSPAAAALLSRRCDDHPVQTACQRRAILGRSSIAFLSASNR